LNLSSYKYYLISGSENYIFLSTFGDFSLTFISIYDYFDNFSIR